MRKARVRRATPTTKAPDPMPPGVLVGAVLDREVADLQTRLDAVRATIKAQRDAALPPTVFAVSRGGKVEMHTAQNLLQAGDRVGIYQLVRTRTLRIINGARTMVDE